MELDLELDPGTDMQLPEQPALSAVQTHLLPTARRVPLTILGADVARLRVVVLGAGFGGLQLASRLSDAAPDRVEVTLIDRSDAFVFGFAKLDVMFGHATADAVRLPYRHFVKPGVRLLRETVTAIDPATRRVTTDAGTHDADYLVVALGADYDVA